LKQKIVLGFCSIILILSLFSFLPILNVQASPDSITASPSAYENSNWNLETRAYADQTEPPYLYAWCGDPNELCSWMGYDFSGIPGGSIITEVMVMVDHYESEASQSIGVDVSWDGGTTWSNRWLDHADDWTQTWMNFTDVNDGWTTDMLSSDNFRVRAKYYGSGGCYPDNMYFLVAEAIILDEKVANKDLLSYQEWQILKPTEIQRELREGRILYALTWNETSREWFLDKDVSEIIEVEEHTVEDNEGKDWILYDIWSGELDIDYTIAKENKNIHWKSHVELTSEHLMYYSLDKTNYILDTAETLYGNWSAGKDVWVQHLWWNYTLKPFLVTNVTMRKFSGTVYNVKVNKDLHDMTIAKKGKTLNETEYNTLLELKDYGVPINKFPPFQLVYGKIPTTYLDWIPAKVTYTEAPPSFDCNWIAINNTLSGYATLFSTEWTDLYDANGLSHFLFSTNRTGTWQNDTWSNAWRDTVWADHEAVINNTGYIEAFRFYVNDTAGTEYGSSVFCVQITNDDFYIWWTLSLCWIPVAVALLIVVQKRRLRADRTRNNS